VKHAGDLALTELEPLIAQLRALPGLTEKKRGIFYRKSRAFLHFHEDPKGLFADVRNPATDDFDRYDITAAEGREALVAATQAILAGS
jgi:hypothetical protein